MVQAISLQLEIQDGALSGIPHHVVEHGASAVSTACMMESLILFHVV